MSRPAVPIRFVDGLSSPSRATRLRALAGVQTARAVDASLAALGRVEPLVFVSGFWRSGTTWLQECLAEAFGAKTVFEPLSPLDPDRRIAVARLFGDDEDLAQAYLPEAGHADDDVFRHLDPAMQGRATNSFTLSCRPTVRDALRRRVVVKDVRAQNLLGLVHARYRVPVVHLRRHPCSVVASLVRANWHWSFRRTPLATLFARTTLPPDLAEALPGYDGDEASRIAFSWAWSERRAAQSLHDQPWGTIISYEELAREPTRTFDDLCTRLALPPPGRVGFDRPSASIHPADFAGRGTTLDRWRADLSAAQIERIETIASAVFPDWRAPI